ncbi:MAG TPA: GDSL-type esterase/lipase family protein [Burkholderiaceae bacterium]|nr:GDSL-type esterase/lipase family protein [Burkholderiaceae bacterium]
MTRSDFLRCLAATGLGAALATPALAIRPADQPLRILPIGDSITQGGRLPKEYTYRWQLARLLSDEGIAHDFIGTRHLGLDPAFRWPRPWNDAHEGYYGATTRAVVDQVTQHLGALPPPDIALVYLGTNDSVDFGNTIITPLIELVGSLRVRNPDVAVLIGRVPKAVMAGAVALELRVDQLARLSTPESPVVIVPIDEGWVADPRAFDSDTLDGAHPNLRGQRKMAEDWLLAIRQLPAVRPP